MKQKNNSTNSDFKWFKTILLKDLKSEIRQINDLLSIILFDLISVFIFSTAYNISTHEQAISMEIFVIEIWIIVFFTLIFIFAKLFTKEKEKGTLNGLLSSPLSTNTLFLSKIVFSLILLSFIELILIAFAFFISNPSGITLNIPIWGFILIAIVLPMFNLCITGTLVSALSMYVKNKSFILSVLLFPILLPIASPIISMNIKLLQGFLFSDVLVEFLFLSFHTLLMFSFLILISDTLLYE